MRVGAALALCMVVALSAAPRRATGGAAQIPPALTLATAVEREINADQTHEYRIAVGAAGTFLRLTVLPGSSALDADLLSPAGEKVHAVGAYSGFDPCPLSYVAETAGEYRLVLRLQDPSSGNTSYTVRLTALEPATDRHRARVHAEQILEGARQPAESDTADSVRAALQQLNQARALFRDAGDLEGEARALDLIAMAHCFGLGELQASSAAMRAKIDILRTLGEPLRVAHSLEIMRWYAQFLNDHQAMLDLSQEALEAYEAAGDQGGIVNGLMGVGNAFRTLSLWERAAEAFDRAEAADVGPGNSNHPNIWLAGQQYQQAGLEAKAVERFEQAADRARALGKPGDEADFLNSAAGLYAKLGRRDKALDYVGRVLSYWEDLNRTPNAATLTQLGRNYGWLGEHHKAVEYLDRALAATPGGGSGSGPRDVAAIGIGYHEGGELEKAIACYEETLRFVRQGGNRSREARLLARIAAAERDVGRYDRALGRIKESLALYETLASAIASPGIRTEYFTFIQDFYDLYIDVLMRMHAAAPGAGHAADALRISEQARGRVLLDLLTEARVDIRRGVDPVLLEKERSLRRRLDILANRQRALRPGERNGPPGATLAKEIEGLIAEHGLVDGRIRAASPRYTALTKPVPLSAPDIQRQVLDADTVLLEFALGNPHSFLWVVSQDSIASVTLPPRVEIETAARRVYDSLIARNRRPPGETTSERQRRLEKARAEYPIAAAALADMILAPAVAQLGRKRLVIVAQGALQYIPFAALPDPAAPGDAANRPPLVVTHETAYLPSASVLATMREELRQRAPAPNALAIVADPVFDKHDARVAAAQATTGASETRGEPAAPPSAFTPSSRPSDVLRAFDEAELAVGGRIPRVSFSRREATAIAGTLVNDKPFEAFDFRASKDTATDPDLSRFRIVHFATHALLNDAHAGLSGLVLSLVDERGAARDGFLRLHDIFNMNLPAELVVLSACQTALGKDARGEGLVGLARGFMYAGAARVAASLWRVDDAGTAELMSRFYRHMLRGGLRPAAALRAAQVEMSKEARWQDPYFWAAFQIQGEWR